ncbi:MAG: nitronate monooxygenase [Caulobacteraceae bacterium]|nr:nitronate monooxygenase [Caulobacteraceae bacterium]
MAAFLDRLGVTIPIVQAPMAGISTPRLAASVSEAGGLGSISVGATDVATARTWIAEVRRLTSRAFNVNVFVHATPVADPAREAAWIAAMAPLFREFGAEPPVGLRAIYNSFADDDDMMSMLVEAAPPVVSLHFGLPSEDRIARLKAAGCVVFATVTSPAEAATVEASGVDAVVAQGYEAGGHRGVFDPGGIDDCLGTMALTRLVVAKCDVPVIAAGGIMDGRGVRAALDLGAIAAQLGTAFIACPESAADESYRAALAGPAAAHTVMTRAISGRPARCLPNRLTEWGRGVALAPPDYPIAYDAAKALSAAAKSTEEAGFGAHWAGQGAPLSRAIPAAELVARLWAEARVDLGAQLSESGRD